MTTPISPGSERYRVIMERHRAAVERWGVDLGRPSADLVERAKRYAAEVQAFWHNEAGAGNCDQDRQGSNYCYTNCLGQLGAELFAQHFQTVAGWNPRKRDDGWDVVIPARLPALVDAKTRQALLTIRPAAIRTTPEFYALIEQIGNDDSFTFCGVITLPKYLELTRSRPLLRLHRELTYWVGADDLIPPAHFHPFER